MLPELHKGLCLHRNWFSACSAPGASFFFRELSCLLSDNLDRKWPRLSQDSLGVPSWMETNHAFNTLPHDHSKLGMNVTINVSDFFLFNILQRSMAAVPHQKYTQGITTLCQTHCRIRKVANHFSLNFLIEYPFHDHYHVTYQSINNSKSCMGCIYILN